MLAAVLAVSAIGAGPCLAQAPAVESPAAAAVAPREPVDLAPAPPQALQPVGRGMIELSPWTMFLNADILVKGVMLGLAFASLVTWTVFLGKSVELFLAGRRLRTALARLATCRSLGEARAAIGGQQDVVGLLIRDALQEAKLSDDIAEDAGLRDRVASRFQEIVRQEGRSIRRGMGLLATIGSTSPFVGLFGTVWGIMNSFIGISKSQTTNLAVVAPGIAEALLATAIGLVAAIPAVIVYNHFARATKGYLESVGRASGAVGRLLSRDLDRSRGRILAVAAE